MRTCAAILVLGLAYQAALCYADGLHMTYAEVKLRPDQVLVYCMRCHDGEVPVRPGLAPTVDLSRTHPLRAGVTCLSCHRGDDPRPTPVRCVECHAEHARGRR